MENKRLLISVIVPVYNVESYISTCIKSIINQSYSELEIILVDDGSTDNSGNICDKYAQSDNRIKVIHKTNGGLSDARNAGLDIATGTYIGFVDSDDFIETDMYEVLLNSCINNDVPISICGRYNVDEDDNRLKECFTSSKEFVMTDEMAIKNLLNWENCDSAAWDKLYESNLFNNVRYPVGELHEDLNVTARLFGKAGKIAHVGKPLYNYRQRSNSITKQAFNPKKIALVKQPKLLYEYIIESYPQLKADAQSFVFKNVTGLLSLVYKSTDKKNDYFLEEVLNECRGILHFSLLFSVGADAILRYLVKYFLLLIRLKKLRFIDKGIL